VPVHVQEVRKDGWAERLALHELRASGPTVCEECHGSEHAAAAQLTSYEAARYALFEVGWFYCWLDSLAYLWKGGDGSDVLIEGLS
jgi:hypothetical protein